MRHLLFLLAVGATLTLASCQDHTEGNGPVVNQKVAEALAARYPSAQNIVWRTKGQYKVAEFTLPSARTAVAAADHSAWFDNNGGWYMTQTDIPFSALPEAVRTAFHGGEYAQWQIDDVDLLEREGTETIYVIEVEGSVAGVETDIDLYYSPDGVLVRKVVEADPDNDYEDYIPSKPAPGVEAYLKANYPNARILDIDREDGVTEVELLDGTVCRELLFDGSGAWLYTKTEMRRGDVPATVLQALEASEYAAYRIDDIDLYQTPDGSYYRFELESRSGDVKVDITPEGTLTVVTPGGGGEGGGVLTQELTEFIAAKYPGARIIESDYEEGLLEVEIYHDAREKSVYFNGSNAWVRTEWDARRSELPAAVTKALQESAYASYEIDDIEFVQKPAGEYYRIELERGEQEVTLCLDATGKTVEY